MAPERETRHPELSDEQRYLDLAYEGLEVMRGEATTMLQSVLDLGRGGTFQSRTERDIVVRTSLARLAQLDIGDEAICFGRIDRAVPESQREVDGGSSEGERPDGIESFHIGRLAVWGPGHEPLVVDWRAPVAEPFYRATGLDPQGLARRRHLAVRARRVVGLEDEYFLSPERWPPGAAVPGAPAASEADAGLAGDARAGPGPAVGAAERLPGERHVADGLPGEGLMLGGPGALLAALGAARTGRMGDIVATIQREQDEIIRSPLPGVLVVQGGPGTGKTAVALHRAAYLLYTHRFPLERQGVLVLGPNPLFLGYIEQVLPSLGETGVTLSTVTGLVPEVCVRATEPEEVARLKGDPRMVRVLARAVRTRQRPLRGDVAVPLGATVLRLTAEASREIVSAMRRRRGTHNARRRLLESLVVRRLGEQYRRARASVPGREAAEAAPRTDSKAGAAGTDADAIRRPVAPPPPDPEPGDAGEAGIDLIGLRQQLRRVPAYTEALERMWPRLEPHELLHDLLGAEPLLAAAGRGILSPAEQAVLFRPRSASLDAVAWTAADAALVDEARVLLGARRPRNARHRREVRERPTARDLPDWGDPLARALGTGAAPWDGDGTTSQAERTSGLDVTGQCCRAYGHIVVDEVQGLSPMQLRMIARRSLSGSMTVVGDIAQATGPSSPGSWDAVAEHLSPVRPVRRAHLTVSYRTPAEVVGVAANVLAEAAPGLAPPRPVRRSGAEPSFVQADPLELGACLVEVVTAELEGVGEGRLAVLAPEGLVPWLEHTLAERGLDPVDPRDRSGPGLEAPLVLLPAEASNGLEFDSVVVVEPALVAAGWAGDTGLPGGGGRPTPTPRGLRTLYVALTRPTRRLAVVHSQPLPAALRPPALVR